MGSLTFFARNGLNGGHRLVCDDTAQTLFPGHQCAAHRHQGYCSYTLLLTCGSTSSGGPAASSEGASASGTVSPDGPAEAEPGPLILQFRPPRYGLDIETAAAALRVYGDYAPRMRRLGTIHLRPPSSSTYASSPKHGKDGKQIETRIDAGPPSSLDIYALSLLPGAPYSSVQVRRARLTPAELARQKTLVTGFADFMARGWRSGTFPSAAVATAFSSSPDAPSPPSSPSAPHLPPSPHPLPQPGPLHASIPHKLLLLSTSLPTPTLRSVAKHTLASLHLLSALPITLNHGDIVPGNAMLDPATGELQGLVDWAEAEVGTWGLGLYGLEFLLGSAGQTSAVCRERRGELLERADDDDAGNGSAAWADGGGSSSSPGTAHRFTYYASAPELRSLFWAELTRRVGPPLRHPRARNAAAVARDVGVLLWFGFAWDDGNIDRVVNERDDPREVVLLDAFLGSGPGADGAGALRRASKKAML